MKRLLLWISLLFCLFLTLNGRPANAQKDSRSLRWDRYDVTIDQIDTATNRFNVTESYTLFIETGPFRFGTAQIPMGRLTDIQNFTVTQGETELFNRCTDQPGTYCAQRNGSNFDVTYYFLESARTGNTVRIRLKYTVLGALRSYEGGDQVFWMAIPADRPFPIMASKVTVRMPEGRPPQIVASYPNTWQQSIEGNTVTWTAPGSLSRNASLEVRVQYPHDPAMQKPSWQAAFDFQRSIQPLIDIGMLILGGLIGLGGSVLMYIQYARYGRDPEPVVVPDYLTEPPSVELPGVVGSLLDEKADMQDILATLMDLARRGFIVIEQTQTEGIFGMFKGTEFEFHLTDKDQSELRSIERQLIQALFGHGRDVTLSSLKNKFYTHISGLKSGLLDETVRSGYFKSSPEGTRTGWGAAGLITLVLGGAIAYFLPKLLAPYTMFGFAPGIGIGLAGLVILAISPVMPAKTAVGSQEAAKWRAFRTYLRNIKRYTDLSQANDLFEKYIGFAVAFGLQQEWFNQFANALTSMPTWYYPTYMGGRWGRGYRGQTYGDNIGGSLGDMGNLSTPGGLNEMSQSLSTGLNAMSDGLTEMLNSASSVMTSQPNKSGGSGGWSGGGGFSGGSSGGGSRGFG